MTISATLATLLSVQTQAKALYLRAVDAADGALLQRDEFPQDSKDWGAWHQRFRLAYQAKLDAWDSWQQARAEAAS